MSSPYTEYAPDRRLSQHVACYWSTSVAPGSAQSYAVLPGGCIDLLFDTGCERVNVVGAMSRAPRVQDCGPIEYVGIRFRSGGAISFLAERANLFTDRQEASDAILGRPGRELGDRLANAIEVPQDRLGETVATARSLLPLGGEMSAVQLISYRPVRILSRIALPRIE